MGAVVITGIIFSLMFSTYTYREAAMTQTCDDIQILVRPFTFHYINLPEIKRDGNKMWGEVTTEETEQNTRLDTSFFVATEKHSGVPAYIAVEKKNLEKNTDI